MRFKDLPVGSYFKIKINKSVLSDLYFKILADGVERFVCLPEGVMQANHTPTNDDIIPCSKNGDSLQRKFHDIPTGKWFLNSNNEIFFKTWNGAWGFGVSGEEYGSYNCGSGDYTIIEKPSCVIFP